MSEPPSSRLYEEAQQRWREAELFADLACAINSTLDLDTVLALVAARARELCGADMARIALREPGSQRLFFRYLAGPRTAGVESYPIEPGKGLGGLVLATGQPFRTASYGEDPRIDDTYLEVARQDGVVACMGVPIRSSDETFGVLFVANQTARAFSDHDEAGLLRLADHAAVAIRNVDTLARERAAREFAQRTVEALQESEERYRNIVEGSIQGILIHQDQVVRFANRALLGLLGYEREDDVVGRPLADFLPPGELARMRAIRDARDRGETIPYRYEVQARRRTGDPLWLEILVSPVTWDVKPAKLVAVIDVSDRKEAEAALRQSEEQLREAQKMEAVGRLAGGVAHDFNNLLTVIRGRTEFALSRSMSDELRRDIELIDKAAARAVALTTQLLAFSRRQVLHPKVLSLSAVVSSMDSLLRRLIGEDIELISLLDPDVGSVRADPAQLEQVVLNLAVNGRDAMPRGGTLTLETRDADLDEAAARQRPGVPPGRHVVLTVTDTGHGMDPATLARVFEPFFTTKSSGKGTGLGLATVYGIVRQSGGQIWVGSEPDAGTTFEIYLPRVGGPAAVPAPEPAGPALGGTETVLLVEDQPEVRELAREILEASGYRVLEAHDPAHAVRIAESEPEPVHLLVTDVVMPVMSGRELAERLKVLRPGTKVLYMSGYTDDAVVRHGVVERGVAFLQKPFTPDVLVRTVRTVLDVAG